MFEGEMHSLLFTNSVHLLQEESYLLFGKMLSYFLALGGNGMKSMSNALYCHVAGLPFKWKSQDLPGVERNQVEKV